MTVVHGSAQVPGPEAFGDDRVVHVFLGDSGYFKEAGGLSYSHVEPNAVKGPLTYSLGAKTLPACADPVVAPCVETGKDRDIVHVDGAGVLAIQGSTADAALIDVSDGAPARELTFIVRH